MYISFILPYEDNYHTYYSLSRKEVRESNTHLFLLTTKRLLVLYSCLDLILSSSIFLDTTADQIMKFLRHLRQI